MPCRSSSASAGPAPRRATRRRSSAGRSSRRLEPQRRCRRRRAGHRRPPRAARSRVTATVGSAPYLEVQTAHDLAFGLGQPIVHQEPHTPTTSARRRWTSWSSWSRAAPGDGELLDHGAGRRDRPGRRGRDGVRRADGGVRPERGPPGPTRRHDDVATSTGSAGRWRSSSPTGRSGRYANGNSDVGPEATRRDLRRREGRPSRRPQADVGSGQRLPREPERGPSAGRG